ncbi:tRNA-dihydrouridine synthase [Shigella flexneri]
MHVQLLGQFPQWLARTPPCGGVRFVGVDLNCGCPSKTAKVAAAVRRYEENLD